MVHGFRGEGNAMRWVGGFGQLLVLSALLTAFHVAHVLLAAPMSQPAEWVAKLSFPLFLILWVNADARRRCLVPCFDFGLFLALFFWSVFIWYVFWSRGVKGLLVLLGVFGLMILPPLLATIVRALV
jgi:hypothetical protein